MPIYRDSREIIIVCERCDDVEFSSETDDVPHAFWKARQAGWRARSWKSKQGEANMETVCPECRDIGRAHNKATQEQAAARKKENYERWNNPFKGSVSK